MISRFRCLTGFDLKNPSLAIRIAVDEFRMLREFRVGGGDFATDGRVNIAGGLDRFHHRAGFAGLHLASDGRRLYEHDVGQFVLGVVADADGGGVALNAQPFVGFGVF